MPIYEYKCDCGARFERVLPMALYQATQYCDCGRAAEKQLSAPAVRGDYEAYDCPITGKRIEGRRAHEENLRAHGCRVLEPGETREVDSRRKRQDEALDKAVERTAEEFVAKLSSPDKEALGTALDKGLDVGVVRK